jgi:phage terminase large subunit
MAGALALINRVRRLQRLRIQPKEESTAAGLPVPSTSDLARWRADPVAFFRECLGIEPWSRQIDILRAVQRRKRVAVRSGHKVSKSLTAAGLAIWWVVCKPRGFVILSAPSGHQVRNILWEELRRLYAGSRYFLGPPPAVLPSSGWRTSSGNRVLGITTDTPERMAGSSGAELLYIIDEASGYPEAIFEAIEGNRAGGGSIVLFSNPTQTSGTFFDAFHRKAEFYEKIHISSEESPNVVTGNDVIPGLATLDYIEEKAREWGKDSPLYQIRIGGNFPTQSSDAVIGLAVVNAAALRWAEVEPEGPLEAGLDVARYGDDESIATFRRGKYIYPLVRIPNGDGVQVAAAFLLEMRTRLTDVEKARAVKVRVKVDAIGVGASAADQLRTADDVEVFEINVSENADDEEHYHRLRDQLWFGLGDWLKNGGTVPPANDGHEDGKLHGELLAPKYLFDNRNRQQVESKDDIKKRLHRSPDRADSLCLAVYNPTPPARVESPPPMPENPWGDAARGFG